MSSEAREGRRRAEDGWIEPTDLSRPEHRRSHILTVMSGISKHLCDLLNDEPPHCVKDDESRQTDNLTQARTYLHFSHPPPLPRLLLPAMPALHHLIYLHCHSFATTHLYYCCTLYTGSRLKYLGRVKHTTARPIGDIPRAGYASSNMQYVLHWFPFHQTIILWIAAKVWWCSVGLAPAHIQKLHSSTSGISGCCSLCSEERVLCHLCSYSHKAEPLHGTGLHWPCDCSQDLF